MSNTPLLALPEISESQSGKYITHNEAVNLIEALVTRVISRTNGGPPPSPSEGDTYIVDSTTGDWSTASINDIAHYFSGGWNFITPVQGIDIYCIGDSGRIYYTGSSWTLLYTHKVDFSVDISHQDYVGEFDTLNCTQNTQGFGGALRFDGSGDLVDVDNSSASTMPCSVLALENGTGSIKVLWRGKAKNNGWSFTPGGYVYAGSNGALTQTRPSNTGDQVQVLGTARASGEIIFNPSYVTVEIA